MLVESPQQRRILLGIGDDAAVWQPSRSHRSVVTTDAMIEGVHFDGALCAHDVGWRAMAANLSDIAAMGARPVLCTVALGMPERMSQDEAMELYRGLHAAAREHRCAIAGGDVTRAPVRMLSITVIGEVRPSNLKTRAGMRPGDIVAITGPLGASRAGLHLSERPNLLDGALREEALNAHCRPSARVREGQWLAASSHVHAMMDVSDGLSTDLAHLARASQCGVLVESVPVAASALAVAQANGEDPERFALAGGEEFELLVALAPRAFAYLAGKFSRRFGKPLLQVGRARAGGGVYRSAAGREEPVASQGWDHLTPR